MAIKKGVGKAASNLLRNPAPSLSFNNTTPNLSIGGFGKDTQNTLQNAWKAGGNKTTAASKAKETSKSKSPSSSSSSSGSNNNNSSNMVAPTHSSTPTFSEPTPQPKEPEYEKASEIKVGKKQDKSLDNLFSTIDELSGQTQVNVATKENDADTLRDKIKDIGKESPVTNDRFHIGNKSALDDDSELPDIKPPTMPNLLLPKSLQDDETKKANNSLTNFIMSKNNTINNIPHEKTIDEKGEIPLYFDEKTKPKELHNESVSSETMKKLSENLPKVDKLEASAQEMIDSGKLNVDKQVAAINRGGEVDYNFDPTASGKYEQAYNIGNRIKTMAGDLGISADDLKKAVRDPKLQKIAGEDSDLDLLDYMRSVYKVDEKKAKVVEEKALKQEKRKTNKEIVQEELKKRQEAAAEENRRNSEKYNTEMTEWNKADKAARDKLVAKAKEELSRVPENIVSTEVLEMNLKNAEADLEKAQEAYDTNPTPEALSEVQDAQMAKAEIEKELRGNQFMDNQRKDLQTIINSAGREIPGKLQSKYVKDEVPPVPISPEMNMDQFLDEWSLAQEMGLDISGEEHRFTPDEGEMAELNAEAAADAVEDFTNANPDTPWQLEEGGNTIASSEEFKKMTQEFNEGFATPEEVENINSAYSITSDELIANPKLAKDLEGSIAFINEKYSSIKQELEAYKGLEGELDMKKKDEYKYWKSVASNMNMKIAQTAIDTAGLSADMSEKGSVDVNGNKIGWFKRIKADKNADKMLELAVNTTNEAININPMNLTKMSNTQIAIASTPVGVEKTIDSVIGSPEIKNGWQMGLDISKTILKEIGEGLVGNDTVIGTLLDVSLTGQRRWDLKQHSEGINALMAGDLDTFKDNMDKVISNSEIFAGNNDNISGTERIRYYLEQADEGVGVGGTCKNIVEVIAGPLTMLVGAGIVPIAAGGAALAIKGFKDTVQAGSNLIYGKDYEKSLDKNTEALGTGLQSIKEIIDYPGVSDAIVDEIKKEVSQLPPGMIENLATDDISSDVITSTSKDNDIIISDETGAYRPGESIRRADAEDDFAGFNRGLKKDTSEVVSDERLKGFIKRNNRDPLILAMYKKI